MLSRSGGIRPPIRKRTRVALSFSEREEISRGIASDCSLRSIASQLDRAPSTISREVKRNGGLHHYRASGADQAAWGRAHRPKPCKLILNKPLCRQVVNKLQRHWAPPQIAGWLKREYPGDKGNHVSHETIYKSLFIQARGALKKSCFNPLEPNVRSEDPSTLLRRKKVWDRSPTGSRFENVLPV